MRRPEIVQEGGEEEQKEETPVPAGIEVVARREQHGVLRVERALRDEPVQDEDDREEQRELYRVEQHGPRLPGRLYERDSGFQASLARGHGGKEKRSLLLVLR